MSFFCRWRNWNMPKLSNFPHLRTNKWQNRDLHAGSWCLCAYSFHYPAFPHWGNPPTHLEYEASAVLFYFLTTQTLYSNVCLFRNLIIKSLVRSKEFDTFSLHFINPVVFQKPHSWNKIFFFSAQCWVFPSDDFSH